MGWWIIAGVVGFCVGGALIALLRTRLPKRDALPWAPPQYEVMRGLAHEIRNPLNAMSVTVQLLEEDMEAGELDREELKAQLGLIRNEAERLEAVLSDFQRYARIMMRAEAADIGQLIDDTLDFMTPTAEQSGIEIVREIEPLPVMAADPKLLQQAFLNVILNAFQAMQEGGELKVEARQDNGADSPSSAHVLFSDTGPGIAEEAAGRVFEPFFSTKPGGTGLGMSVARQAAELHGGSVEAGDRPGGGGTQVEFRWPIRVVKTMNGER